MTSSGTRRSTGTPAGEQEVVPHHPPELPESGALQEYFGERFEQVGGKCGGFSSPGDCLSEGEENRKG
jgi:hypothetical protein